MKEPKEIKRGVSINDIFYASGHIVCVQGTPIRSAHTKLWGKYTGKIIIIDTDEVVIDASERFESKIIAFDISGVDWIEPYKEPAKNTLEF